MPKVSINTSFIASSLERYIIHEKLLITDCSKDRRIDRKIIHDDDTDDLDDKIQLTLGLGVFDFTYKGHRYQFQKVAVGDPLPSTAFDKDAVIYENTFICGDNENTAHEIMELTKKAMQETKRDGYIKTYVFDAKRNYWDYESSIPERSFSSVILEPKLKQSIIDDVNDFVDPQTKVWFQMHGINYRRCYLLTGPPGCGKTSVCQALTSHLKRNIHRIDLGDPELTDSGLLCAVNSVDKSSVIVFEDIDTMFDSNRHRMENVNITFSGLLNSLDGISVSRGQIFVLTTNYANKLDVALKRKGRVDRIFEFNYTTKEQAKEMYLRFYPRENKLSDKFALCIGPKTPTSDLQHHFIMMRKKSAEEASNYVQENNKDGFETMYA